MFFFARFSSFYKSLFVLFNNILVILTITKNANGDEQVIIAHGISTFGDLKYKNNFKHLDYVNPSAPKGGEVSIWAFGSFDSMHPYTTKGRSGSLSSIFFESLSKKKSKRPLASPAVNKFTYKLSNIFGSLEKL